MNYLQNWIEQLNPTGVVTLDSDAFSDREYRRLVRGQPDPMVPPVIPPTSEKTSSVEAAAKALGEAT